MASTYSRHSDSLLRLGSVNHPVRPPGRNLVSSPSLLVKIHPGATILRCRATGVERDKHYVDSIFRETKREMAQLTRQTLSRFSLSRAKSSVDGDDRLADDDHLRD